MFKINLRLTNGELTIEFSDTQDLENQLKNLDLPRINLLLDSNCGLHSATDKNEKTKTEVEKIKSGVEETGLINLLKISENGQDATKLALFLASNGLSNDLIKKITGITLLSD